MTAAKRDKVVSMRLTAEEHAALSAIAERHCVDLSELIRRAALALTYPPPPVPDHATFTLSAPLARIGYDLALIPRVPPPVVDVPLPDEDVTL